MYTGPALNHAVRRALFSAAVVLLACAVASPGAPAQDAAAAYKASVEEWRHGYEASLESDDGWLSVAGLFWLHDGQNRFGTDPLNDIVLPEGSAPADVGYFDFEKGDSHDAKIVVHVNPGVTIVMNNQPVQEAEIRPDSSDRLVLGNISLLVHKSGDRYSICLKDKNSKIRRDFAGTKWFAVNEAYRVTAKFVLYDPAKQVDIQNILGDTIKTWVPGYLVFTLRGAEYRLEPFTSDPQGMEFVFRDLTSGKETYPAVRMLKTSAPKDGLVTLDFNESYNPPCAYNPYTTCPLPPPQNRLRVRIEAGEMLYKSDRGK
jgi:uncharacterized protein (DUF1684 family)